MASSVLTLEQLPDDVLVLAMQFVSVEDVLSWRLVCKRLCDLALHRDVWRHRSLRDDEPCADAVLHLAPCLDKLKVTGPDPSLAVTTTRCAVACLDLRKAGYGPFNAAEYALAVRNQEHLGRLRRLVLGVEMNPLEEPTADVLFWTVASCSGLDRLEVLYAPPIINQPVVHGPPSSSLKVFKCVACIETVSLVNTVLAGHAATLEEVEIYTDLDLWETTTADLLAAMPRLRSLRCDCSIGGLEKVAECKTLRDLDICLNGCTGDVDNAAKLLRRANQLRHVLLDNAAWDDPIVESWPVLAEALAWSGRFPLERLALKGFEEVELLGPLIRALPSLPALRFLYLDTEPVDELLKSISPAMAPALRLLRFPIRREKCPHAWIHRTALKTTLLANPLLHIQLWGNIFHSRSQDCAMCVGDCDRHQGVEWHNTRYMGFYSHDPDTCPCPEDHSDHTDWKGSSSRANNFTCTWIHMKCNCT
ncbi:uncharacterized protein LOC127750409 [Frankliniella occidentalis]|uniref:Uncharacterized protein LOC127750409 n=1 Tax=Frankliniella occidentalis TaxID=133901 RepID=A0A9C6XQV6_FRAOC|nr:uncharacterized protein LOC127750409 [Frankliniella occidentalis]